MSKKCTPLWREANFQVKMHKTPQCRTTFGSCHVEKVHAVVARSTCWSENVQSTTCSPHFWRFRCRGRKGLCTLSKVSMTWGFCSSFNYNHYNHNYTFTTFHYTTPHYTALHSITFNYTTLHYTALHYTTLHSITQLHSITLHYTTLHYTTLHYITPHYTPLHHTTLHYTTLHWMTLHHR